MEINVDKLWSTIKEQILTKLDVFLEDSWLKCLSKRQPYQKLISTKQKLFETLQICIFQEPKAPKAPKAPKTPLLALCFLWENASATSTCVSLRNIFSVS